MAYGLWTEGGSGEMRTLEIGSYVLMGWYCAGVLMQQLFPKFCAKVLQEYRDGKYDR